MASSILQWSNLSISTMKGDRQILQDITGEIKSGESLAIMGSSGAGKTTFLNFLSKKSSTSGLKKTSGEVRFILNNIDETISWRQLSGYVTQDDILFEVMSPRELLLFAANMRLPKQTPEQRNDVVEKLILRLGLEKCADTKVGHVMEKGLSGGERKRTAIGYELITDPYVLFLDEPTTGLDSTSAFKIIKLMTDEAKLNNRIIIFTIHQPNSEIFTLFDKFLLFAQGKTMYQGRAKDCIQYFENLGHHCPKNYNPAEYFIKVLSKESRVVAQLNVSKSWQQIKEDNRAMKRSFNSKDASGNDLNLSRQSSSYFLPTVEENTKAMEEYEKTLDTFYQAAKVQTQISEINNVEVNFRKMERDKHNFFTEFLLLFKRNMIVVLRNKEALLLRFLMIVMNSMLVILVFWQLGTGDSAVQDRRGALFFIGSAMIHTNIQNNLIIFTQEKPKFYKDQESNMYGVVPYFLAKTILEFPIQLILTLLLFSCTYFSSGLDMEVEKYFIFMLVIYCSGYCASTFAVFMSSLFDNREIIPAIFPFLLYTQIQASGFFVTQENTPYIFYPFRYISVFRYCFQGLVWNEFNNIDIAEDLKCKDIFKCGNPTDDFQEDLTWSILSLVFLAIFMNFIAILALKIKVIKKLKSK
jgi:ABC-type multidrug transport system ATPase subunit